MPNPLRLIVGLGNPGREYAATRHNAGAWFAERLAARLSASFDGQAKFHALVNNGEPRIVVPQTFMNRSGLAVERRAFLPDRPTEMLSLTTTDLKPGIVKLKHGGVCGQRFEDIAAVLGTGEFWRLRIGIGHPRDGALSEQEVADYVLRPPAATEQSAIDDALVRAFEIWPRLVAGEMERAMHELHTRAEGESPSTKAPS
jgi:PTH1 family peptidyl-tRNA hydrolase